MAAKKKTKRTAAKSRIAKRRTTRRGGLGALALKTKSAGNLFTKRTVENAKFAERDAKGGDCEDAFERLLSAKEFAGRAEAATKGASRDVTDDAVENAEEAFERGCRIIARKDRYSNDDLFNS